MAGELVLLTGATGFLGYQTLVDLLKSGYRVRAVVRSQAKTARPLAAPSLKALNPTEEQLSWVVIPDLSVEGAFDEAIRGVRYVVHVAAPILSFADGEAVPQAEFERRYVQQSRGVTLNLLEAARAAGTVERVVVTSSLVAVVPLFGNFLGTVWTAESRVPDHEGPLQFEMQAYIAGKVAALNATDRWMADSKPGFDVVNVMPSWVFGRDELATSRDEFRHGSDALVVDLISGVRKDQPTGGNSVLASDVARVQVLALDAGNVPRAAGSIRNFGASKPMVWEDALEVVKRDFPDAIAQGRLSLSGTQPTGGLKYDASKTEEQLGIKFASWEDQVREVTEQYLEVSAKAA